MPLSLLARIETGCTTAADAAVYGRLVVALARVRALAGQEAEGPLRQADLLREIYNEADEALRALASAHNMGDDNDE